MNHAIRTRELTRRFGRMTAVDRVTLDVTPGSVFALIAAPARRKLFKMCARCSAATLRRS